MTMFRVDTHASTSSTTQPMKLKKEAFTKIPMSIHLAGCFPISWNITSKTFTYDFDVIIYTISTILYSTYTTIKLCFNPASLNAHDID